MLFLFIVYPLLSFSKNSFGILDSAQTSTVKKSDIFESRRLSSAFITRRKKGNDKKHKNKNKTLFFLINLKM